MNYRVVWEIDIEADSPREAAAKALAVQQDRGSIATVFDVYITDDHNNIPRFAQAETIDISE